MIYRWLWSMITVYCVCTLSLKSEHPSIFVHHPTWQPHLFQSKPVKPVKPRGPLGLEWPLSPIHHPSAQVALVLLSSLLQQNGPPFGARKIPTSLLDPSMGKHGRFTGPWMVGFYGYVIYHFSMDAMGTSWNSQLETNQSTQFRPWSWKMESTFSPI